MRLVLGTAQIGMDYGIINRTGRPDPAVASLMIQSAIESGVQEFDTAQVYGNSEHVLGHIVASRSDSDRLKFISKPNIDLNRLSSNTLKEAAQRSSNNLGIHKLYGFLLHKERMLEYWEDGLGFQMTELLRCGLVDHIGVSVYTPEKANQALDMDDITILQIPSNVLDRRFENAGIFEKADGLNKQIYVRSVYLQGLLLADPNKLPQHMHFAVPALKAFESFAREVKVSKHSLALAYVRDAYTKAKIIVGSETLDQFQANLKAWQMPLAKGIVESIQECFTEIDDTVLNPSRW
jgi:aryl-alcohol dehydrogenase-like predicted oxidoreductase